MASIIPGYEYDIFISYRQKDNKGDRWVSEFVDALRTELESTFKEDISLYFDINTHDGLLETHDVDASLKDKLKCLVFIPIISRTYCDTKSFAWEHEFKAFAELASQDQFGLKLKLPNGNVVNRILPIRIHDLDKEDIDLCESVIGSVLRGVEFIYKEPGVNKPLTSEDDEKKNSNNTKYKIQINKVANAVKEIAIGLRNFGFEKKESPAKNILSTNVYKTKKAKSLKLRMVFWSIMTIGLIVAGYFLLPSLFNNSSAPNDKSIAVLPFKNMSNDPAQDYFSDGMKEEILNHLFKIGGLKIPSSSSTMRFKESDLTVIELARKLGVSYVLEGNVSRSGDNVRIIVRLINGKNEQLLWTEDYRRTMTAASLLEIQSDVAQQVADNMKVVINPEVRQRIEAKPTVNTEAYTLFLMAENQYLPFDQGKSVLEKAISLDPGFAEAYALLGGFWIRRGTKGGDLKREQVVEMAEPLIEKSLQLDKNSILAHSVKAYFRLYYYWDFESVEKEFQICKQLNPSNSDIASVFSDYLLASGKFSESLILTKNTLDQDKNSINNWIGMALSYYYDGQQDKALETMEIATRLFPEEDSLNHQLFTDLVRLLVYTTKYDKAIRLFEKSTHHSQLTDFIPYYLGHLGIAYFKTGNISKSGIFLNELLKRSSKSPVGSPSFFAAGVYTAMGENEKALQMLEKAYSDHEVEMYWLKVEPLFRPLHGYPRFENLLLKIGFK